MQGLDTQKVERYLKLLLGKEIHLLDLCPLGDPHNYDHGKSYGYGTPIRIDYRIGQGTRRSAVLHTMSPGPFGHEHMADRARSLIWSHQAFNHLPHHVRSLDIGGFEPDGSLISLGDVEEFCLLTDYVTGNTYAQDLERMLATGELTDLDVARADVLCDYLTKIHSTPGEEPGLYVRRLRELIGDGECIMGLTDSYPAGTIFSPRVLEDIEHRCSKWRWRLKNRTYRLRQVHGDFHPWNILFESNLDFHVLDRSRGEFGDPADDVTCITLNYVFFSLQRNGRLEGGFDVLFRRFWNRYLEMSGDHEVLEVVAPFFVFRALVMASPIWYPELPDRVRQQLLAFIEAVLSRDTFDPSEVNAYCGN